MQLGGERKLLLGVKTTQVDKGTEVGGRGQKSAGGARRDPTAM
jgi:hypothetical protein